MNDFHGLSDTAARFDYESALLPSFTCNCLLRSLIRYQSTAGKKTSAWGPDDRECAISVPDDSVSAGPDHIRAAFDTSAKNQYFFFQMVLQILVIV
jgi:hypothetical protein